MPRPVLALTTLAFAVTVAYAASLSPEFEPSRDDQLAFAALARGLAERGEFTRAGPGEAFFPETLRAPGYPLFVAALCRTVGCGHWQIALAQGLLVALLVVLTHALAKRALADGRPALVATALVAVYPTFAYFAALEMADILGAVLLMGAALAFVRSRAALSGALFGALALTRFLFGLVVVPVAFLSTRRRLLALALGFAVVVTPLFVYSYSTLGTLSSGSSGSGLWYGYFQRLDARDLDSAERASAAQVQREIDAFDAITDRRAQALAWPRLDALMRDRALALIATHPLPWLARGVDRSLVLWAGDRPVRVGTSIPDAVAVALLAAQLVLFVAGLIGSAALARRPEVAARLPLLIVAYTWLSAFPFVTEERYALPARPFLFIGAVAAWVALRARSRPASLSAPRRDGSTATDAAAPQG
ncbi:MAG: glycosyltransferase family 39 protein [Chloroflexi bacterium]|nr:glycosyltransferase family 39 protein [Chloroflexota bacterium]